MVRFFRAKECSQSFRRRSSVIVLRISISFLSWASVWMWVTHKLLVSSVMLLIWIWAAGVHPNGALAAVSKKVFILNRKNVNFVILIFIYLQVLYLQVVNTDVVADGVIDSSHRPINLVHFLSQPAHLSWRLPVRDRKHKPPYSWSNKSLPCVGDEVFYRHINVYRSRMSWSRSQVEARDTSAFKPVMFLPVELLREDNLSSSCTK